MPIDIFAIPSAKSYRLSLAGTYEDRSCVDGFILMCLTKDLVVWSAGEAAVSSCGRHTAVVGVEVVESLKM